MRGNRLDSISSNASERRRANQIGVSVKRRQYRSTISCHEGNSQAPVPVRTGPKELACAERTGIFLFLYRKRPVPGRLGETRVGPPLRPIDYQIPKSLPRAWLRPAGPARPSLRGIPRLGQNPPTSDDRDPRAVAGPPAVPVKIGGSTNRQSECGRPRPPTCRGSIARAPTAAGPSNQPQKVRLWKSGGKTTAESISVARPLSADRAGRSVSNTRGSHRIAE